jgi:hypothetical protein
LRGAGGVNTTIGPTLCFCCNCLALSDLVDTSPIIPIVTNIEKIKAINYEITTMTNFPEFMS